MLSHRGGSPLHYRRIGRADLARVELLDLDPDQLDRFLGPLTDIVDAVRRGPLHSLIGVEREGELIGFYVVHPDRRDAACWWLGWLAIARAHQGFGHGRTILATVLARLGRIPGCRRVRLLVATDNHGARRLYGRYFFRPVDVDPVTGELVLEYDLEDGQPYDVVTPRTLGRGFMPDDLGHLRLRPHVGPHAAWVIGVERGPPV
jgi:RimJ/RimL family protein N-acetyltransferase